jgi:hypothetical protein
MNWLSDSIGRILNPLSFIGGHICKSSLDACVAYRCYTLWGTTDRVPTKLECIVSVFGGKFTSGETTCVHGWNTIREFKLSSFSCLRRAAHSPCRPLLACAVAAGFATRIFGDGHRSSFSHSTSIASIELVRGASRVAVGNVHRTAMPFSPLEHQPRFRRDWLPFSFGNIHCRGVAFLQHVSISDPLKRNRRERKNQIVKVIVCMPIIAAVTFLLTIGIYDHRSTVVPRMNNAITNIPNVLNLHFFRF